MGQVIADGSAAEQALDVAAAAVASSVRRRLLEHLAERPATMTELADRLGVSLPAVHKHIAALAAAGLVRRVKAGRVVTVELVPGSLDALAAWALQTRLMWAGHLDQLAAHLSR